MTLLKKIISGGQNGVDQAALRAAKACGLATGGWMPLTYRTIGGPRPEFATLYGMCEHESMEYPPRTNANVRESAATLRIAADYMSAGERCTLSVLRRHGRPHYDVVVSKVFGERWMANAKAVEVADWIVEQQVVVLNVAGNSEVTAPGIGQFVEDYLCAVLGEVHRLGAVSSPP